MKIKSQRLTLFISLSILVATGCKKEEALLASQDQAVAQRKASNQESSNSEGKPDAYVVQSWYDLMMKLIIETPGNTPPIAARSFGYTGITLYESLVGEMPLHHSLAGQLNGLTSLPKRQYGNSYAAVLTANAALAKIIGNLFQNASAENLSRIVSLEAVNDDLHAGRFSAQIKERSRNYGYAIADAVYKWSLTDGGNQAYLNNFPADYLAPTGAGRWVATPPLFQNALLPYWGNNRTMVPANGFGPIDPPAPPVFSTSPGSPFYAAAYEVYSTGLHLSAEQKTIALYWADGGGTFTPPGHNIATTLQLIRNYSLNLYEAAILLAKVGVAENDAGIVCWRAKFTANLLRPITFIRSYIDPSWTPLIGTPPFPSYTSGHATFSGAAAAILSSAIGDHTAFADSSKMAYGFNPRSFNSFNEAAQEAAISRLYGGIHYGFDNENGFKCGQLIAMNVEHLNW